MASILPPSLKKKLEETFECQIRREFPLSSGLSGAVILLLVLESEHCIVLKIGPAAMIEKERRNFDRIEHSQVHDIAKCRWHDSLGSLVLDESYNVMELPPRSVVHNKDICRIIAYKYLGEIRDQNEPMPLSIEEKACQCLTEQSEDKALQLLMEFKSYIAEINNFLRRFRSRQAELLSDYLEPDWKKAKPFFATASAMCFSAISFEKLRSTWEQWKEKREKPAKVQFGIIHGDLRCANIVESGGKLNLVDFGGIREAPVFIDLVRLEIDILFRANFPSRVREQLVRATFDPELWCQNASNASNHSRKFIHIFRQEYVSLLNKKKNPPKHQKDHVTLEKNAREDFYMAYLCELLRRLPYWEDCFLTVESRHFLWWLIECTIAQLANVSLVPELPEDNLDSYIVARKPPPRGEAPLIPSMVGLRQCYAGASDSDLRNKQKRLALENATGTVVLLAHTGFSYLCMHGGCHYTAVEKYLKDNKSNQLKAILLDPFSQPAFQIYLNWTRSAIFEKKNPHHNLVVYGHKYRGPILGYRSLRNQCDGQIELRMTCFDPRCTILWTNDVYFFEPYLQNNAAERDRFHLDTFELELSSNSALGTSLRYNSSTEQLSHLDFYYSKSVEFDEWWETRFGRLHAALGSLSTMFSLKQITEDEMLWLEKYLPSIANWELK